PSARRRRQIRVAERRQSSSTWQRLKANPVPAWPRREAGPCSRPAPHGNGQYHGTLVLPREWPWLRKKRNWHDGLAARPSFSPSPNRRALLVNGGFLGLRESSGSESWLDQGLVAHRLAQ